MSTEDLSPGEKAHRTRLLQRGLELHQSIEESRAELEEVKQGLYAFAEPGLDAGETSVTISGKAGACTITRRTTTSIDDKKLSKLKSLLGVRFESLVASKVTHSLTSAFKKLLEDPDPVDADLAEKVAGCVKTRESTAVSFKPAA